MGTMSKRQLHLGIPAMPFENGTSGIGVYINKIIRNLSISDRIKLTVFGFESDLSALELAENVNFVKIDERFNKVSLNLVWHLAFLPVLASLHGLDVLFLPAGNRRMSLALPGAKYKVVATVHDLAQFHLKNKYDKFRMYYVRNVLPFLWEKTPSLISVSESTKNDLVNFTGVKKENVRVVLNGVEHSAFRPMDKSEIPESFRKRINLPEEYILYVARIEHPGKNHLGLIKAYEQLRKKKPDLKQHLVFCGSEWQGADIIKRQIATSGLQQYIHFTGFIQEFELSYLYSGADLFAFPSLFEGFGIPAIEAMAAGVPVVAANRASLPEIVGDAGLLFDPEDTENMADALLKGIFDLDFRKQAISAGLERAELFSWDKCSENTLDALLEFAEH